jgi:hypothetical protein
MSNLETAYNQAMEQIQKGRSKQEVLLEFAEHKNELAPLLDISLSLLTLPKNIAPQPAMQRKYALAPSKGFWLNWVHISKFAGVSMSLMLLLSAFAVTAYATLKSGPGQALFSVKKLAEQSQMILAYNNQNQKASIQVAIAQQRLDDAKQIFSDPGSNIEQKTAALNELANQTSNAVAVVNSVATSNPKSDQNHPLLSSLDSITQQQQSLLTAIAPGSQITVSASSALQSLSQTAAKISQIKNYVATASNAQNLAQLDNNPNAVAVLGQITKLIDNQITVEKTAFTLTTQTIIQNPQGTILSVHDLSVNQKVNVIGIKIQDSLVAKQIFIIPVEQTQPEVKGESTGTTTPSVDSKKAPNPDQDNSASSTAPASTDSGSASAPTIFEDPSPQFQN